MSTDAGSASLGKESGKALFLVTRLLVIRYICSVASRSADLASGACEACLLK